MMSERPSYSLNLYLFEQATEDYSKWIDQGNRLFSFLESDNSKKAVVKAEYWAGSRNYRLYSCGRTLIVE